MEFYSHENKKLIDHLGEVETLISYYAKASHLKEYIDLSRSIGFFHDFAKYTSFFQKKLRGEKVSRRLSQHALLSSLVGAHYVLKKLKDPKKALFAYVVIRHHHIGPRNIYEHLSDPRLNPNSYENQEVIVTQISDLKRNMVAIENDFSKSDKEFEIVREFLDGGKDSINELHKKLTEAYENLKVDDYFDLTILFSSLLDADRISASDVVEIIKSLQMETKLDFEYFEKRRRAYLAKKEKTDMDILRENLYNEIIRNIERALEGDSDRRIYRITAPTGSGKTLASIAAALKIIQRTGPRKIIYSVPFINIIEQTYGVLTSIFGHEMVMQYHHLTVPRIEKEVLDEPPIEKLFALQHSWYKPIVLTTFVQLFKSFFGSSNTFMRKAHHLAGNILIIDEFHSLHEKLWKVAVQKFKKLSQRYDTHVILMSATLPEIYLSEFDQLVENYEELYEKLNRVKVIYILDKITLEEISKTIAQLFKECNSLAVILNTIKTSQRLFKSLENQLKNIEMFYLSTSVPHVERRKRIDAIKRKIDNGERVLLITTQVIEAGVDLDFDCVIRDMAPFDSIVQSAGRCNRSGKKEIGKVLVVNIIDQEEKLDAIKIYDTFSINIARNILKMGQQGEFLGRDTRILDESTLLKLTQKYFKEQATVRDLEEKYRKLFEPENIFKKPLLAELSYNKVDEEVEIIKKIPKVPIFVEINEEASSILEKLNEFDKMPFHEKEKLKHELQKYVVEVYETDLDKIWNPETVSPKLNYIYLIRKDEISEYYDHHIGFRKIED